MITAKLKKRGTDEWGSGEFGAPRGDRQHNGVDYACEPITDICSPVDGHITKLGYCYSDDLSFRYVQITEKFGRSHRLFYVDPLPKFGIGDYIDIDEVIGQSQKLGDRYPGITEHVHYEVIVDGEYVDPVEV